MKIYLFDSTVSHENLLPLSFTRPVADFRCGIVTIREKWEKQIPGDYAFYPVDYLRDKFGSVESSEEDALFIAGNLLPRPDVVEAIIALNSGEALMKSDSSDSVDPSDILSQIYAYHGTLDDLEKGNYKEITFIPSPAAVQSAQYPYPPCINYVFDIFLKNGEEIIRDFQIITKGRRSQALPACVKKISSSNLKGLGRLIFIEKGAKVDCASINLTKGPVYIGKDAVLMEGACIRGPFALCEASEIKMGAKIYEGTTIGPHCKIGGELSNAVFFGYSNKAHDGFLGNAVIGEWCNLGAGVNASNLKNDYSLIRVWNYRSHSFMKTDLQFCGLIMGDHSKIGVNCMINTATVVGVGVNLHGSGFPRNFVPCFCEGSPISGFNHVPLNKFLDIVGRVMTRRDKAPTEEDVAMLTHIYEESLERV